ncbi:MAG: FAD-dependent oxidoreductase [Streptosporangiaceae bacterium]
MRCVIVGAGLVGLSVAWFLQEHGEQVTVVDRSGVAAGASWGNAGWLSPGLATPLPEPAVLRYGLKTLLDPGAALSVPARLDPSLWGFLLRFARNCTPARWDRAMNALAEVNGAALDAYDELSRAGVTAPATEAPIMAAFNGRAAARPLLHELAAVNTPHLVHNAASHPSLTPRIGCVVEITGQRYIDPGAYTAALAEAVTARGGIIRSGFAVARLRHTADEIMVEPAAGEPEPADAVVLATGAWLDKLARPYGVRRRVRAGRGYSFDVATSQPVTTPVYFPVQRVACTPYRGRLRVAGTMEFRGPDEPPAAARFDAIVGSVRELLSGVNWESATRHWVGPRPVTADGLPLIGATSDPRVFVAGGHGMWGITLGPVTGMLLAERIVTGKDPKAIGPFNPLR